jgi:hypothetical protein
MASNLPDALCGANCGRIFCAVAAGKPAVVVGDCAALNMSPAVASPGNSRLRTLRASSLFLTDKTIAAAARTNDRRSAASIASGSGLKLMPFGGGAGWLSVHNCMHVSLEPPSRAQRSSRCASVSFGSGVPNKSRRLIMTDALYARQHRPGVVPSRNFCRIVEQSPNRTADLAIVGGLGGIEPMQGDQEINTSPVELDRVATSARGEAPSAALAGSSQCREIKKSILRPSSSTG